MIFSLVDFFSLELKMDARSFSVSFLIIGIYLSPMILVMVLRYFTRRKYRIANEVEGSYVHGLSRSEKRAHAAAQRGHPIGKIAAVIIVTALLILTGFLNISDSFASGWRTDMTDWRGMMSNAAQSADHILHNFARDGIMMIPGALLASLFEWRLIEVRDLKNPVIYGIFMMGNILFWTIVLALCLRTKTTRRYAAIALYTITFWLVIFPIFAASVAGLFFVLVIAILLGMFVLGSVGATSQGSKSLDMGDMMFLSAINSWIGRGK